jgi:O-antigen/teichoic acid export membrane protein
MIKKLFSHTAIYGLAPQLTKLASFFVLPIITKDLTAVDYGVSGVITAYTTAISVFASLGLRLVLVNSFFKSPHHYKWLWRQVYGFLTLWNIVYAIILSALIYFIVPTEAVGNQWLIVGLNVLPLVFFGQTQTICSTYYQINQKPFQIALRSIIFGLITIALNIYFISHLKLGYMGWFWSTFIVGILVNISFFYPLNFILKITPILNYKWRLIRQSLSVSLPTVPHHYSGYLLGSSDKAIMDLMHIDTSRIGVYNVATLVSTPAAQLASASTIAIGPLLNTLYKKSQDERARNLIFFWQGSFLVGTFIFCIWLKEIFAILIKNESLKDSFQLGIIMVMAFNYRPMYAGANAKILYAEKTKILWRVSFIAGISNVLMNVVAIPIWGFEAAAYTTFISYMYMGYSGFYFKVFREINPVRYYPEFWLALTIATTALVCWLVNVAFAYKIAITLVVLALSVVLLLKTKKMYDEV